MTEKRLLSVIIAFFAFAFLLQINLVIIMCKDYYVKATNQTVKTVDISNGRAEILDCNFKKMTGNESKLTALVNTKSANLQDIFNNLNTADQNKFYNQVQNSNNLIVELENPVEDQELYLISKRYSENNVAQHLLGYIDSDGNGITGLEKALDDKLKERGEKISLKLNVNALGEIYGEVEQIITSRPQAISLTIDNTLQRMSEALAKEYITNGSITIIETKTGKVKAMASTPSYDANNIANYLDKDNSPLLNKALQAYEPGSVIKPLWAAAMLENGVNPDTIYECKGYTIVNNHTYHCANKRAHGAVDMNRALVVSCNCYFIDMNFNNKSFILKQLATQMNFGSSLMLTENYYTNSGTFPSVDSIKNIGQLSSISFGQGEFLVTPMHIGAYMSIFANDGVYVYPQVVQGIYDTINNTLIENLYHYDAKQVISKDTANIIKDMLVNVVNEGASSRAKPEYLSAGGKTGTSQTGKIKENGEEILNAWFAGFYPAENPQYTIVIMLHDGQESTYTTTPIFKKICDEIYYLSYLETND